MTSLVLKINPVRYFYLKRFGFNDNLGFKRTWPCDLALHSFFQPEIKYFCLSDQSENVAKYWFGVNFNPPHQCFVGSVVSKLKKKKCYS